MGNYKFERGTVREINPFNCFLSIKESSGREKKKLPPPSPNLENVHHASNNLINQSILFTAPRHSSPF